MPISSVYLNAIQKFEGFTQKAQWDYAQYTNGYGTRAQSANEVVTKAEAEKRFKAEIAEASSLVDRFAPGLDEGTKSALTSLTFNAGTAWMKSGLGRAVISGNLEQARDIIVLYNKAGGEILPGLVARRTIEASWIGTVADRPATVQAASLAPPAPASAGAAPSVTAPDGTALPAADLERAQAEASYSMTSRAFVNEASTQLLAKMTLDVLDFLARADASAAADEDEKLDA